MNSSDYNLVAFKAIITFSNELAENFGKHNHALKLYDRLLIKTSLAHDKAIKKHVEIFRLFCLENRDGLLSKDAKKLINCKVVYSERVYIDFGDIFKKADLETTEVIWRHLLTLSALLDPAGNAKEILKNSSENVSEADFLANIINKVESHVDPNANPMEAVSSIMNSGIFNELLTGMNSGIQEGSLDLGKLMGTVQTMCSSLTSLQTNQDGGTTPGQPDMSQIMGMIGPMLTNLTNKPQIDTE